MKQPSRAGTGKKDKSLAYFHGEAATSSIENAGCAYQAPSVIAAGAEAHSIAFLSAFTNLILSFLMMKVPSLMEKQRSMKRTTVIVAIVSSVTWLPIVLAFIFFKQVNPSLLIGLWVLGLVPTILLVPLRDHWLSSVVPADRMGRYLSWRSAIAGVSYLGFFYLMGYVLDISAGNINRGYAMILSVAFVASAVSLLFYWQVRPPPHTPAVRARKKAPLGLVDFLQETRKSHLGTFIVFISLFTFAVNLSGPLFSAYMLNTLKLTYMNFTLIISCEYIARIISLTFWGRQVDRIGSLRILMVVAHLIPFIPILWLFSHHYFYLCMAQMFSGVVWAAFDLCSQTFLYKATPQAQRLRYLAYYRSLTTFSVALGAIAGAFLLNNMVPIFGSQILGVFLVSGVLRMVVVRAMLPRLKPGVLADAPVHPELAAELAVLNTPIIRQGLYYYPESWARFVRQASSAIGGTLGRAVSKLASFQGGIYYTPQKWAEYLNKEGAQFATIPVKSTATPRRDGLYYHRDAWARYQARAETRATPSQPGLYYNPQGWADYLRQSLVLDAATMRTAGDVSVLKQGIFYHPELWEKYKKATSLASAKKATATAQRQPLLYHPEKWERYAEQVRTTRTATTPARRLSRPAMPVPVRRLALSPVPV